MFFTSRTMSVRRVQSIALAYLASRRSLPHHVPEGADPLLASPRMDSSLDPGQSDHSTPGHDDWFKGSKYPS